MANLFYAFTSLQLTNMYNLKCSYYKDIKSDLYIHRGRRISAELIRHIYLSGVFDNIYVNNQLISSASQIEMLNNDMDLSKSSVTSLAVLFNQKKILRHVLKLYRPINYINYLSQYSNMLRIIKYNNMQRKYDRVFIGTFGKCSPYIVKTLLSINKSVHVSIVEEGTFNYNEPVRVLSLEYLSVNKMDPLYWVFKTFGLNKSWCQKLETCVDSIYLYSPKSYPFEEDNVILYKLPDVTIENPTYDLICSESSKDIMRIYSERNWCLLLQDPSPVFAELTQAIAQVVTPDSLILRKHPSHYILNTIQDICNTQNIYLDTNSATITFEAIFSHIEPDNFVLITTDSSASLTPKYMFNKEPYIIYIHNISMNRCADSIITIDKMINSLRNLYTNKNRIYTPKSMDEFTDCLAEIYQLIK